MGIGSLFFDWRGRIGRAAYWLSSIPIGIIGITAVVAVMVDLEDGSVRPLTAAVVTLLLIGVFYCSLCIQVKRWHDRDKSAIWLLMNFLPYVGSLWVFIECGFLRGTDGPNRFDLDPEDRRALDDLVREQVTARVVRRGVEEHMAQVRADYPAAANTKTPVAAPAAPQSGGWEKPAGWQPGNRPSFGRRGL